MKNIYVRQQMVKKDLQIFLGKCFAISENLFIEKCDGIHGKEKL